MFFDSHKILNNLVNDQKQRYLVTKIEKKQYNNRFVFSHLHYEYFLLRELSPVQVKVDDP